jgi:predicted transcriptional regulator
MAEQKFNPFRSMKQKTLVRRTGDLILLSILETISERDGGDKPARYTHIMFASKTNPFVCTRYLEFCKEHGLIEVKNKTYHLTTKGRALMNMLRERENLKEEIRQMEKQILEGLFSKNSS